ITGDANDKEKFLMWAESVPYTMRNPLYHWTHLELQRYFGIQELLTAESAEAIYEKTSDLLQQPEYSTLGLLEKMKVEIVCTTDDPIDTLEFHIKAAQEGISPKIFPAFRPDKVYSVEDPSYLDYLKKLEEASGVTISGYKELIQAVEVRIDFFHQHGGRLSDHGLEQLYYFEENAFDIEQLFLRENQRQQIAGEEIHYFRLNTHSHSRQLYLARGWAEQSHVGAMRKTNARMLRILRPHAGFACIGDLSQSRLFAQYPTHLDSSDQLT